MFAMLTRGESFMLTSSFARGSTQRPADEHRLTTFQGSATGLLLSYLFGLIPDALKLQATKGRQLNRSEGQDHTDKPLFQDLEVYVRCCCLNYINIGLRTITRRLQGVCNFTSARKAIHT
ncbi:hypothetical protein SAMN05216311_11038 [Chitinophaga sp. CF418]|nr:hypothetical protein SAMN05216311_11038 [Chitinophaga sp. CF418]